MDCLELHEVEFGVSVSARDSTTVWQCLDCGAEWEYLWGGDRGWRIVTVPNPKL